MRKSQVQACRPTLPQRGRRQKRDITASRADNCGGKNRARTPRLQGMLPTKQFLQQVGTIRFLVQVRPARCPKSAETLIGHLERNRTLAAQRHMRVSPDFCSPVVMERSALRADRASRARGKRAHGARQSGPFFVTERQNEPRSLVPRPPKGAALHLAPHRPRLRGCGVCSQHAAPGPRDLQPALRGTHPGTSDGVQVRGPHRCVGIPAFA